MTSNFPYEKSFPCPHSAVTVYISSHRCSPPTAQNRSQKKTKVGGAGGEKENPTDGKKGKKLKYIEVVCGEVKF